jgi:hypothetical protein
VAETEKPRWTAFALALAVLVLGAAALALGDRGGMTSPRAGSPGRPGPAANGARAHSARDLGLARLAATRFARAYLGYERGAAGAAGERAISRYSTPRLGGELLAAPVHLPPGARPPRRRVAGIAAVAVGLLGGEPVLVLGVRIAGGGGSHLLRVSLLERDGRWLVAGIGP